VTNESADGMELRIGMEVFALVKASFVLLFTDPEVKVSSSNKLWGRVQAVQKGSVNAEVTIELPSGKSVIAIVTQESCEKMGIVQDGRVCATFNASSVILAVVN
jgi:molybdate transport system regulatory protein